jgi:DNA-binding SARP family transcriptional activator/Tfp pilus assembly protein PilF
MEFRLLGEMQLRVAGRLLDAGTPRQQAVLAALAVDAGRPIPIETLIDRVWGDNPPTEARNVLYSHLSRIRQMLKRAGTGGVDRRNAGYVLQIDPGSIDLHRFVHLAGRGNDPRLSDTERAAALTEALDLWQGAPLAGISGEWADQVRTGWHRRRVAAAALWGELELRLDRPEPVIGTLSELADAYPLAEPLEALLIRALHVAGRDAEAVDRYATVRQRLAEALGTEPGPELRALHTALLRGELPTPRPPALPATPAQLPPDIPGFAGREAELDRLDTLLAQPATATRIIVLSGTAGVGKTTVAVHWAHTVRAAFPDGQLYVNLRGFDPTGSPVTAAEAMRGFLEALEVPPSRIPTSLEAQAGLCRSLLANRRILVVLDNARDAERVRPLLPGAPGCLVLVTSRDQLAGLIAAGAHLVEIDLLDDAGARAVLRARLGPARLAAEPLATNEIIRLCARLPLALAVVAARAVTHPGFRLAALAGQLRDARGGLDEFAGADPATDPRVVFSWSYLRLNPVAARLFRLLGLHPGPDIGTPAAASLAGLPASKVRPVLAELAAAHLIAEPTLGRYTLHDLLRAYAAELVHEHDSPSERESAVRRMLSHYAHTAYHADGFFNPRREVPRPLTPLPPGAESERIADHAHALAWFKAEHHVLILAIHQDVEFDTEICELARWTSRFLAIQGHWHDEIILLTAALDAARRLNDRSQQAFAHCYLGCAYIWFGRYDEASADLHASLDLYVTEADRVGQAYVHHNIAWLHDRQGKIADALAHAEQALGLFRAAEHQAGQAMVLNAVGWFHALLGDYQVAVELCQEALDLQTLLGLMPAAAESWHSLGYIHSQSGDNTRAVACYEAARDLYQRFGYLINEAQVLVALADAHHGAGDLESARAVWRRAYTILEQFGHPDAAKVLAKLADTRGGQ